MSELVSRSAAGLRRARPGIGTINSEGVTAHYLGPSPWGGADRSSPARFRDSTAHARCASIWRAVQAYHSFLCHGIEHDPRWMRTLERALNPVLGKSLVVYTEKVDPTMTRHRRERRADR